MRYDTIQNGEIKKKRKNNTEEVNSCDLIPLFTVAIFLPTFKKRSPDIKNIINIINIIKATTERVTRPPVGKFSEPLKMR